MIYTVVVTKGGNVVFSHDILLVKDRSFQDDINAAMDTFRKNFPTVSLFDDDVELSIRKKP